MEPRRLFSPSILRGVCERWVLGKSHFSGRNGPSSQISFCPGCPPQPQISVLQAPACPACPGQESRDTQALSPSPEEMPHCWAGLSDVPPDLRAGAGEQPQTQPKEMVNRITTERDLSRPVGRYTVCSQRERTAPACRPAEPGETEGPGTAAPTLCSSKRTTPESSNADSMPRTCPGGGRCSVLAGSYTTALLTARLCPSPVHLGHVPSPGSDF